MNIYKVLGNRRKVDISSATFGSNNEFAIINVCDISSIKKFEKTKQRARFQTVYLHSTSHGVRTPLTSIHSANENLKMTLEDRECL